MIALALLAIGVGAGTGCRNDSQPPRYVLSKRVQALNATFQAQIKDLLEKNCGHPNAPKYLGGEVDSRRLRRGAEVYRENCLQCHGLSGDGEGPVAVYMNPRPRDYRPGIFKFISTSYGSKPLREDLIRTIRRGILGTSMPSFDTMPQPDVEAVADYVISLALRGEFESQLADQAEFDGAIDLASVPNVVKTVSAKWSAAKDAEVTPNTPMPAFTASHVEEGRKSFVSLGCVKCHGDDGRGETRENIGVDGWGRPTKAADLTSGFLRGGPDALDIYRHVDAGINGTPMPSFHELLRNDPKSTWNLVAWVLHLSARRRLGDIPEAGLMQPLPGLAVTTTTP